MYAVAFAIIGEIAFEIAIPVVILVKLGQWLDARYAMQPKFMIAGLVTAFVISAGIIWKRAKYFQKLYDQDSSRSLPSSEAKGSK